MTSGSNSGFEYLTVDDVLALHDVVVSANPETEPGVQNAGKIEYALARVEEGHYGRAPETIHEKAFQLMRLLAAGHPFVDGNKRTALITTATFYALNGTDFEYDAEIKQLLKQFAVDESLVDRQDAVSYFESITTSADPEYQQVVSLLSSLGATTDSPDDTDAGEDNGYQDEGHTGE